MARTCVCVCVRAVCVVVVVICLLLTVLLCRRVYCEGPTAREKCLRNTYTYRRKKKIDGSAVMLSTHDDEIRKVACHSHPRGCLARMNV